jgi:hypothetical protein
METRFNFAPTSRFQGAGIVICFDQNPESRNCWRVIERQFWGPGQIVNFSGDQKLFPSSTTYLRLRKKGALYTAWFSADGRTWTEAGTREERRTPVFAGIMTLCQSYDRNMNLYSVADFDYLRFTQPSPPSPPRTGDPIAKISGTWEFGRVISKQDRQVICHLTLTGERVEKNGGYKITGNRHPNESFWGLEGENTIWFKHADGKITSKLTRREDDYWEGEYIEHKDAPVPGKKLNHYIKRVKK